MFTRTIDATAEPICQTCGRPDCTCHNIITHGDHKGSHTVQRGGRIHRVFHYGYLGLPSYKDAMESAEELRDELNGRDDLNDQILANAYASGGYKSEGDPDEQEKA